MSWETIEQRRTGQSLKAPVSCSLKPGVGGHTRLTLTLSPTTLAMLGWTAGERVVLMIGRGDMEGQALVAPDLSGRPLRIIPRSEFLMVALVPPDDLARWEAPQLAAEFEVMQRKGLPHALRIVLPWDLSGDPAEAEAA